MSCLRRMLNGEIDEDILAYIREFAPETYCIEDHPDDSNVFSSATMNLLTKILIDSQLNKKLG